ncbi:carbohydrate porin [Sphingomonas sp. 22R3R2A-7]|uniref:carbohydrate porin n=1 Tax=Sphingomonas sp. 22R3R2A-7 TaxID=3050230 RepID=UPI002FE1BC57
MQYRWLGAAALALAISAQGSAQDTVKQTPGSRTTDTQHRPRAGVRRDSDLSPSALTADTQRTPPPGLFADWFDIRKRLADRGIGLSARYASESGYNFSGGDRKLLRETGQFDVGMLLDLDKVAGLQGGAFQATITYRRGRDLGADANLGVLQQVQEVYGRGQTLRLTQFWYEQKLGETLELKIGRTNPGEDFAVFSCYFQNLSFCGAQPGNLVGDYWYNWPVGQWGARLRYDLNDRLTLKTAAYEVNPRNLERDFVIGRFHGATGVLVPIEAEWRRGDDDGRVGAYKVGGWINTSNGDDVFYDRNRQPIVITGLEPLRRSARYGVFFNLQQQLTGTSKDGKSVTGLSVFLNATQADRQTSVTDNQVAAGLFYKGLVPWRPGDILGVGVARTNVNGRVAKGQARDPTRPAVQDAEYASEIYYSVHPTRWLELRPNVQLIHNPGGVQDARDVGVLGLKGAITL